MASKFLLILALLSIAELSFIATVVSRDVPSGATSKAILQTGISKANSTNGINFDIYLVFLTDHILRSLTVYIFGEQP